MAAGFSARQQGKGRLQSWFVHNEAALFGTNIVCLTLLFFSYLVTSTFKVLPVEMLTALHATTLVLLSFIVLSMIWKGIVPIIVCILGVVLIHNSVILPYYASLEEGEAYFGARKVVWSLYAPEAVQFASTMHFFLGVSMVAFGMTISHRPSLLFARNRPEAADVEWSKYPVWYDNAVLANGTTEPSVPVKSLISDLDRYLLWRYEYVLASIYGTTHLVRPEGMVPKHSTLIHRDKASGRIMGKARYTGYFM
ncbi:MAG: hypothetical protein ACREBU_15645 [Nitrososphaera sp.]